MRLQYKGWMTPAIVGVISFATGAGAGYYFKKYRDSAQFDTSIQDAAADITALEEDMNQLQFQFVENVKHMDSVIQQANHVIVRFQDAMNEAVPKVVEELGKYVDSQPAEIAHVDTQKTTHPGGKSNKPVAKAQVKPKQKEQVVETGTFPVNEDEDWDYTEELKHRSKERPYILHRDEFFSNESDYRQCSLTYYGGDNILCDEQDVPVYNYEKIVGSLVFGHGSADPSIVYIRNDKLEAEYEVVLEPGYYQTEVLGHEVENGLAKDELKHFVQRFRASD